MQPDDNLKLRSVCECVCVFGSDGHFVFSFDELIFSRRQPSTLWGDEWVINVAAIWSKSICGDPPCSADPECKARGSVCAGGEEEGRDPPERCTCTIRPFTCLTFIVFIDWTGGGAGSQTHRITTISLLLSLPPTLSGSILNPSSIIDQQSVHINISLCMLIMTYSQCLVAFKPGHNKLASENELRWRPNVVSPHVSWVYSRPPTSSYVLSTM